LRFQARAGLDRSAATAVTSSHSASCPRIAVSKNGVASLAYVAGIYVFRAAEENKTWMAGTFDGKTALRACCPAVTTLTRLA